MYALPLSLVLDGRKVLALGGIAAPKLEQLRRSGAVLVHDWPCDIAGFALVVIGMDIGEDTTRAISDEAKRLGVPVNAVDRTAFCTVLWPAVVERGDLTIAIGTGGAAPAFAAYVRTLIEEAVPASFGALLRFAGRFRRAASRLPAAARTRFWREMTRGTIAARQLAGDETGAAALAEKLLAEPDAARTGVVHLVGAGPGDPDLLTRRALDHIRRAEIIVHDKLVSADILALARPEAVLVDVGKSCGGRSTPQEVINRHLVAFAKSGRDVVRLKGGDPFMFGRGGEEIDVLRAHGIQTTVTPGISAALACAAATSIPLTHRDHAHSVMFVTGHRKDGELALNWSAMAQPNQTVVIYMGAESLGDICAKLRAHGKPAATPLAIVANGTRANQAVYYGTVGTPPTLTAAGGPKLAIIGEVTALPFAHLMAAAAE